MLKVYISSTYKDLREEREAAARAVLILKHHPVAMESMTAEEERPLDAVRSDIRECDVLVGVYGLRYGYVPPGETKSITHLEYEAAGEAGIPRLIFIRDEEAQYLPKNIDRDLTQVEAFRAELQKNHVVSLFKSTEELKAAVLASLSNPRLLAAASPSGSSSKGSSGSSFSGVAPEGHEVPMLLPYLCDRSEQETSLAHALKAHREQRPLRPFFCVVHGDVRECHDRFVDRMRDDLLPKCLGRGQGEPAVKHYAVGWPSAGDKVPVRMTRLRAALGKKLCGSLVAADAEMAAAVAAQAAPVLVSTHLYMMWGPDELKLLKGWLRFWGDWPQVGERREVVVVVCVHYKEDEPEPPGKPSGAALIREQLEGLRYGQYDLSGLTLPRLRGIPLGEVHNWANDYGHRFRPADELMRQAREFYEKRQGEGGGPHVPMEELARLLRSWVG
jgi:hypothetical protein